MTVWILIAVVAILAVTAVMQGYVISSMQAQLTSVSKHLTAHDDHLRVHNVALGLVNGLSDK